MSSLQSQFLDIPGHHDVYPAIDPTGALAHSAAGKVVFLSGASSGIGRATAVSFARAGAKAVYITGRNVEQLEAAAAAVRDAGPGTECAWQVCDVRSDEQVGAAVADCVTRFGGIDLADCNAGYLDKWAKIADTDPESWWMTWEVNIRGSYHVIRHAVPHLLESAKRHAAAGTSGGHLILISSVGAQLLSAGASDYQTSKHAVNRLCEFVNADYGDEGLKCFAIHPGGVATQLAKNMPAAIHPNLVDQPELAGGFIVWLASGAADWARGRFLSATWDVEELLRRRDEIVRDDLLVNRLRAKA